MPIELEDQQAWLRHHIVRLRTILRDRSELIFWAAAIAICVFAGAVVVVTTNR